MDYVSLRRMLCRAVLMNCQGIISFHNSSTYKTFFFSLFGNFCFSITHSKNYPFVFCSCWYSFYIDFCRSGSFFSTADFETFFLFFVKPFLAVCVITWLYYFKFNIFYVFFSLMLFKINYHFVCTIIF